MDLYKWLWVFDGVPLSKQGRFTYKIIKIMMDTMLLLYVVVAVVVLFFVFQYICCVLCCDSSMLFLWYATFCPVSYPFCGADIVSRFYSKDSKGFVFLMFAFRANWSQLLQYQLPLLRMKQLHFPQRMVTWVWWRIFCDFYHQDLWITSSKRCLAHDFLLHCAAMILTTWV